MIKIYRVNIPKIPKIEFGHYHFDWIGRKKEEGRRVKKKKKKLGGVEKGRR